jgi:large repetitive protein
LTLPGVLGNDTDVEGSVLSPILVSDVSNGTLTLNADGSFTYLPAPNFTGNDSFTYKVNDGTVDSNIATVTINVGSVNDAPVAVEDSYSINEDTLLTVVVPGVLGNDTDNDGDLLTVTLITDVAHGTLVLNADGSFTYLPACELLRTGFLHLPSA